MGRCASPPPEQNVTGRTHEAEVIIFGGRCNEKGDNGCVSAYRGQLCAPEPPAEVIDRRKELRFLLCEVLIRAHRTVISQRKYTLGRHFAELDGPISRSGRIRKRHRQDRPHGPHGICSVNLFGKKRQREAGYPLLAKVPIQQSGAALQSESRGSRDAHLCSGQRWVPADLQLAAHLLNAEWWHQFPKMPPGMANESYNRCGNEQKQVEHAGGRRDRCGVRAECGWLFRPPIQQRVSTPLLSITPLLSAHIHGKQFQLVGAVPTRALEQSRARQHDDQLARHGSSPLLILQGAGGGLHAASGRVVAASAPPLNTELTSALPRALSRASRRWSTARAAILMRIVGLHKANAMVPSLIAQGVEALSSHL